MNWTAAMAGMSLWELLITLALAITLGALAVPGLTQLTLDNRRVADINALVTAIQLSRSEAAKRGQPVVLCKTRDRTRCGGAGVSWHDGWMVFVNEDGSEPPQRSPTEPLLYSYRPGSDGPITGNRAVFRFRAFLWRSTNGTVTFCDRRGAPKARAVIVSYTGRPRVSDRGPGRPLDCASGV